MSCAPECKLTERMEHVLRLLAAFTKGDHRERMTPNDIAARLGFRRGQDHNRHSHNGRIMAPAQRVIFPLTALRSRGLVALASRVDGRSGSAYAITDAGELWIKEHPLP